MVEGEPIEIQEVSEKESNIEKKEYSYNEGLEKALSEIEDILNKKDIVVVLVNGSGTNVGKTKFTGDLAKLLKEKRIPTVSTGGDIDSLIEGSVLSLKNLQEGTPMGRKGVIILSKEIHCIPEKKMEGYKKSLDRILREQVEKLDVKVGEIDLYIAIYKTDKPFQKGSENDVPLGDLMICNEGAKDK